MYALTIQQPYAELIARGDKRVENRGWGIVDRHVRLAIHAGKGRKYLRDGDEERYPQMAWGRLVAVVTLWGCRSIDDLRADAEQGDEAAARCLVHAHCEGPICWVFMPDVVRVNPPIKIRGQQKLWNLPDEISRRLENLRCHV